MAGACGVSAEEVSDGGEEAYFELMHASGFVIRTHSISLGIPR
jgi:hypothetical protein